MPASAWLPFLLACAAGGMLRFAVAGAVARRWGAAFPLGTLVVNLSGALAIGALAGLAGSGQGWLARPEAWLVAATGFLGSYTTVSSFSLQTLSLLQQGLARRALANVLLSLLGCLLVAALGLWAGLAAGRPGG
jgi:CrcB protein